MNILLSGPIQGHLSNLFDNAKSVDAHWIVCTGDFGIFPDPDVMDRAAKQHASKEFSLRYVGADPRPINIPVLTISGVHDDNRFLQRRVAAGNTEILSNVHFLANGYRTVIGFDGPPCRVTGIGRAYSEATYNEQYGRRSHRHYTRRDIERACSSGPTDLLVVYDHLDSPGIRNVIFATRPKLIVTTSHENRKSYSEVQGIKVISLGRFEGKLVKWEDERFID